MATERIFALNDEGGLPAEAARVRGPIEEGDGRGMSGATVTDDERREVARRLRAIEPDGFSSYSEEHEFVEKALGIWDDYDKFLWHVVADLIEPSCDAAATHTDATATRDVSQCRRSDVDREALLALADDVDGAADDSGGFEPLAGMLRDIARCIREACGVEP